MKVKALLLSVFVILFASCQDDGQIFEKSADERAEEAIASLKEKLIAPPDGWVVKYRPEKESGSFNVLLKFNENNKVNIKTDFGVNEGEFYDQTITYRIDNSLGLELIFETYSFFSYLFEQEGATFEAEYEFNYVNETNGALIFNSKTDLSSPTTIIFQPAPENAENLLGVQLAKNLNILSDNLPAITSVYKLSYTNKDLAFYLSFDNFRRVINFNYAAPASGTEGGRELTFSTGYIIQGDSMVFDAPFTGNLMGSEVSIPGIQFNELAETTIDVCPEPVNINRYTGAITASNDPVALEPTLFDPNGAGFSNITDIFITSLGRIYKNGISAGEQIAQDVGGAQLMLLYYINNPEDPFLAMGYFLENPSATNTIAVKEFKPTFTGNQVQFEFAPEYTVFRDTTVTVNEEAMDIYLNALTEGGNTFIFKASDAADYDYELYNPCTGWSFRFTSVN